VQISFRNFPHSDAVELAIRKRVERMERFFDPIIGCRVVVEYVNRRHHQGNLFHTRVDLRVPGGEVVVARSPSAHHAHEDVYVSIRDCFDAAEKQLKKFARRRRVRVHERGRVAPSHGMVIRIFFEDGGYGFLLGQDGREIYFNRNSVLNDAFDRLALGDEVRFIEEPGEQGPQASTVEVIGRSGKHLMF
jgi:ribosomal subunit interface protein